MEIIMKCQRCHTRVNNPLEHLGIYGGWICSAKTVHSIRKAVPKPSQIIEDKKRREKRDKTGRKAKYKENYV